MRAPSVLPCNTLVFAVLAAALLWSPPAGAHVQNIGITADTVSIDTSGAPASRSFALSSTDSIGLTLGANPALDGSALLVRGLGADGGRGELITLENTSWGSAVGGGYEYSDPSGSRGGVTHVLFQAGVLQIEATGPAWQYGPAGPLDALWVHFRIEDEWVCAEFSDATATVTTNEAGQYVASASAAPAACPDQVCGNGVHEPGEECDDGNLVDDDGCNSSCEVSECNNPAFTSTFDGLRKIIFESETYGCTNGACHDPQNPAGGLPLDASSDVYRALLGDDGLGEVSNANPLLERVLPSEPNASVLYLKLLSKVLEGQDPGYTGPEVGASMPVAFPPLSQEHLQALWLWVRGGAPEDLVVEQTAQLLGTCLPEPDPLKTPPPVAPPVAEGFQIRQTARPLLSVASSQGEDEVCMAIYYDLSEIAPESVRIPCTPEFEYASLCIDSEGARGDSCEDQDDCGAGTTCTPVKNVSNPGNECIGFGAMQIIQDGQSHHSIEFSYTGGSDTTDPAWGPWTYKFEPNDPESLKNGQPCDPRAIDPGSPVNRGCSTTPEESIACIGYGPADNTNFSLITGGDGGGAGNSVQLILSQETYHEQNYPEGVFRVLPLKGIFMWNSHAFNLTQQDSTLEQYLNITYTPGDEREFRSLELFEGQWIFAQFIEPFEKKEVCATSTFDVGTRITDITSHTHRHGTLFRIWAPPHEPCRPELPGADDDPNLAFLQLLFGGLGEDDTICEGPPDTEPMYISTEYTDPVQLLFDEPWAFDDPDPANRTIKYCAVFDNGFGPNSPPVKRWSESPYPPDSLGLGPFVRAIGGPCWEENLVCLGGSNQGDPCGAAQPTGGFAPDDSLCFDGGVCDACPVHGGVTTEDEMFIVLGTYYQVPVPEPGMALGAGLALATLAGLVRRRRSA